jgi:hypothetical protein
MGSNRKARLALGPRKPMKNFKQSKENAKMSRLKKHQKEKYKEVIKSIMLMTVTMMLMINYK